MPFPRTSDGNLILPATLGRYEAFGEIASGGVASVYLGRMLGKGGFERTVAIKILHRHLAIDPEFVAMFLDEARLSARIRHPNVVERRPDPREWAPRSTPVFHGILPLRASHPSPGAEVSIQRRGPRYRGGRGVRTPPCRPLIGAADALFAGCAEALADGDNGSPLAS